jgi:hypothetical protein
MSSNYSELLCNGIQASMTQQIISRDAADKTKGFRLQKLRAVKLLLEAAQDLPNVFFYYAAIEAIEDVAIFIATPEGTTQTVEEDKNYSEDGNLTIFSEAVINTLVSFFDIYTGKWHKSPSITFCFYTTTNFGKERKTKLSDDTIITLPKEKILSTLQSKTPISDELASTIKKILIAEYEKQYKEIDGNGYLEPLKKTTTEDFKNFLSKINWLSGQADEETLQEESVQLVKNSKYYELSMSGKENLIHAKLIDILDQRQSLLDLAERFITSSDIQLVFKMAASEVSEDLLDPSWKTLETVSTTIKDKRNLEEKVKAVCPDYPSSKLSILARKACSSKVEEETSNKSFLSLKYRVYQACDDYFFETEKLKPENSQSTVNAMMKSLQQKAIDAVEELKKDYTYTISNKESVNNIVINLIDSCFICLDEEQEE